MKATLASIFIASFAAIAMTQSGTTALNMTCAQARGIVASQGAVALRTGSTTYDRYIWDRSFCTLQEAARPAWVRTADVARCPIGAVCRSVEIDNGQ
jgi:hypothetical protein